MFLEEKLNTYSKIDDMLRRNSANSIILGKLKSNTYLTMQMVFMLLCLRCV